MRRSRWPAVVFALLPALLPFGAARAADLTFEERVAAQEAIERVRYAHQIGATLPFETAVPRAVLEGKVRTYLDQSAALARGWNTWIDRPALERERLRIERATRMPERLREIEAALGQDRLLFLECFVRPVLVERLTRNASGSGDAIPEGVPDAARDVRPDSAPAQADAAAVPACTPGDVWGNGSLNVAPLPRTSHTAVWTGTEMLVWGGNGAGDGRSGARYDPATDSWTAMSAIDAPFGGANRPAVWTGTEMILWGDPEGGNAVILGSRYDPATDRWTTVSTTGAPAHRYYHTLVWTGTRMIVWGGYHPPENGGDAIAYGNGALYDPATDTWSPMSTSDAPAARFGHTAVWTGTEMIVWGGGGIGTVFRSGGRYDPATDTWLPLSTLNAPDVYDASAFWTGSRMIVWGQIGGGPIGSTGGRYDPASDTWEADPIPVLAERRDFPSVVWTGTGMIVWGGRSDTDTLASGHRYDPATNAWTPTSLVDAPESRVWHTAVWAGTRMIVWGGTSGPTIREVNSGGRYDPATDSWSSMYIANGPEGREGHTAVWTGNQMIVWGGGTGSGSRFFDTGSRYDPVTDSWFETSRTNAPAARADHTTVWTGNSMIVWGGAVSPGITVLNSGGRYDPIADTWTPMSTTDAPEGRRGHAMAWTGTSLFVWGGSNGPSFLDSGGRYDPATDTWSPTSMTDAPSPRSEHVAVWTGSVMIVWGGSDGDSAEPDGRKYQPGTDQWFSMSANNAPALHHPTAVWTGTKMIAWGGSAYGVPNPGGQYDPATDSWTPTSLTGAPNGRILHTAVWTGTEMIVWGGSDSFETNTGMRYDPAGDRWLPVSTTAAPPPRMNHTAVWTGREMIVWGGSSSFPASGGRFVPYAAGDPPVVEAGTNVEAECESPGGTTVRLRATGTGCGALSYRWSGPFPEGNGSLSGEEVAVTLPRGLHGIGLSMHDDSGRIATDALLVTVVDTTPPIVSCPPPAAAECPAQPAFAAASVQDACDASPSIENDAPAVFRFGSRTVTFTAEDASGNVASCASVATIQDTLPPSIALIGNADVDATTPSGGVFFYTIRATDACGGTVTASCVPPSGSRFPIQPPGEFATVTCEARDRRGNAATWDFPVHVRGAEEQLARLASFVAGMELDPDRAGFLRDRVAEAQSALAAGRTHDTCRALLRIERKVPRLSKGRDRAQWDPVRASARRIRVVLGCGSGG